MSSAAAGPLDGVRVLDITSVIMGPLATQVLGDLGADVVTIESHGGDTSRIMSSGPIPGLSGIALNLLRNKRNVELDLKTSDGREAALYIAASADLVVTNLRPESLSRLRLTFDDIQRVKPDIVYCQAQGFASDSPRHNDPAYDDIVQVASGMADAFRRATGQPGLAPTIMADKVCGLTIAYSVLAALYARALGRGGQHIEIPMVDTLKAFMLVEHGANAIADHGAPGYRRILTPHRRPQQTKDGWVHLLPYTARHYEAVFKAGGLDDLVGDERCATLAACIANSDFLYQAVHAIAPRHTTAEWLALCDSEDIPSSAVVTLDQMVDELPIASHPLAGDYRHIPPPARFSTFSTELRRHAPTAGQHTREVLREVGCPPDLIDRVTPKSAEPQELQKETP